MQIFHRLRRLAAALLLVPLVAGIQPLIAAERTQTANVVTVASLADPPGEGDDELKEVPKSVRGDMLRASDGNIYFVSTGGGKGFGGVGRVSFADPEQPNGKLEVVHAFADDGTEGLSSYGGLTQASDGYLYGTTFFGGQDDDSVGTVFQLSLDGTYKRLHDFVIDSNKDPRKPYTGVVEGPDGNLYGTTLEGGNSQRGTLYRISTSGAFSVIHHFKGGGDDGSTPEGQLIVGADGKLYGTTMLGGSGDRGTIYRISTGGQYEQLYSFPPLRNFNDLGLATNSTGANPRAGLMLSQDGDYYGTTYQGGAGGNGTLYRMAVNGNGEATVTTVYAFKGGPFDAGFPLSTVAQGPDGAFYGTSLHGGYGYNFSLGEAGYTDSGTIWRVAPDGSSADLMHSFFGSSADGSQPYAGVLFVNGTLYAIGSSDDLSSSGMVIKLQTDTGGGLPVDLTISKREIGASESITLTWNAPGAETCNKSGAWDEPQAEDDPEHVTPASGSKTLIPGIGIYTYMLSCTDANDVTHHAYVGVLVNPPELETVDGGEIIGGGTLSWMLLALFAALVIRKSIKETRRSCP